MSHPPPIWSGCADADPTQSTFDDDVVMTYRGAFRVSSKSTVLWQRKWLIIIDVP